jgi:hypothetical protein
MQLPELFENLSLDLAKLDRDVINREVVANYSDQDLSRLIRIFLQGIGRGHTVPGNLVWTLTDMADQYQTTSTFSPKQRNYIIQNILEQWHQISVEMRAQLML